MANFKPIRAAAASRGFFAAARLSCASFVMTDRPRTGYFITSIDYFRKIIVDVGIAGVDDYSLTVAGY